MLTAYPRYEKLQPTVGEDEEEESNEEEQKDGGLTALQKFQEEVVPSVLVIIIGFPRVDGWTAWATVMSIRMVSRTGPASRSAMPPGSLWLSSRN